MKRFYEFQLDTENERLWHNGVSLSLTRKAFAVLDCLVKRAGCLVSKDELMEQVWPDVYVGEENLKVYVRELRVLLGDQATNPRFIETQRDRGYRFIAPMAPPFEANGQRYDSQSLFGREAELAKLHQWFEHASGGKRQIIFITGESGIGKTALVETFLSQLKGHSTQRVALGQCVESYREQEAYFPILEAFGRLLRDPAGNEIADLLARQAPTWLVQFPAAVKLADREMLQREILGATRERMLREICETVEALTTKTPLVLVLEDLHWSDYSTVEFLAAVARRRESARLMLIATYRPVEVILSKHPLRQLESELRMHGHAKVLAVESLPKSALSNYLSARFPDSPIPERLSDVIHRHTDGNPLFVVALLEHLVSQKMISETEGGWRIDATVEQIQSIVPDSLVEIIAKQIDKLTAQEQELLTTASVVGVDFTAVVVADALNSDRSQVEECAESLVQRRLILRSAGLQELPNGEISGAFQFTHSLYRELIYRRCSPITRLKSHHQVGEAIERIWSSKKEEMAAELARHFQKSRDFGRAVHYLLLSADNAVHCYAYREAVAILELAGEIVGKLPESARGNVEIKELEQLAKAYDALGDKLRAAGFYQRIAELAAAQGRRDIESQALVNQSRELAFTDLPRALDVAERAVQIGSGQADAHVRVDAETWARFVRLGLLDWRQDLADEYREGIEWLRNADDSTFAARHEFGLAVIQVMTGDYEGALRTTSESLPFLARIGDAMGHFTARWMHCWALLNLGRCGESLRGLREAIALAERNGNAFDNAVGQMFLAEIHLEAFDFVGARTFCEAALPTIRQLPNEYAMQRALVMSALAELNGGDHHRAKGYLLELRQLYESSSIGLSWYWKMPLHCAFSELYLTVGDNAAARAEGKRLRELTDRNINPGWQARARQISARIAIAESGWKRAESEIKKALAIIEGLEVPLVAWRVHETAMQLYKLTEQPHLAANHSQACNQILINLANSFDESEPLRQSVLKGIAAHSPTFQG